LFQADIVAANVLLLHAVSVGSIFILFSAAASSAPLLAKSNARVIKRNEMFTCIWTASNASMIALFFSSPSETFQYSL
jgi:hypothetical protein